MPMPCATSTWDSEGSTAGKVPIAPAASTRRPGARSASARLNRLPECSVVAIEMRPDRSPEVNVNGFAPPGVMIRPAWPARKGSGRLGAKPNSTAPVADAVIVSRVSEVMRMMASHVC